VLEEERALDRGSQGVGFLPGSILPIIICALQLLHDLTNVGLDPPTIEFQSDHLITNLQNIRL